MKVYVDENNIELINDLFEATNCYECWACNMGDDLEIVSIADHEKQVRKEIIDNLAISLVTCFSSDAEFTRKEIVDWLQKVKDQI